MKNKHLSSPVHIWSGIYHTFSDVPLVGKGHEGDDWIQNSIKKATEAIELARKKQTVSPVAINRDTQLPLLVALFAVSQDSVTVLDFGGGLGMTYLSVICAQEHPENVDYHILELGSICAAGRKLFRDDAHVHFHTELPDNIRSIDIVHVGSSLQYVEDWKGQLARLASYHPAYFLLEDLYAGEIPTYATAQYYYGSHMPCWFFNIHEVIGVMKSNGYRLQFRSTYMAKILGLEQESPQDNFPKSHRLGHACNLLFVKKVQ